MEDALHSNNDMRGEVLFFLENFAKNGLANSYPTGRNYCSQHSFTL